MKKQEMERVAKIKELVENESLSKSKRMIALFDEGLSIKVIADHMKVRYNFVYNVVSNHCNMTGKVMTTDQEGPTKKDEIIKMLAEGKSIKEISIALKTNYNYIFNIRKGLERDAAKEVKI